MPAEFEIDPIPQGAVLLHVGMPKTGTSALQHASARSRAAFLENGVRYPGHQQNHSRASFAVARRRRGWGSGPGKAAVQPLTSWTDLLTEVHAETERRVLVSHEYFAEHSKSVCERVVRELDRDVHVVFTLRNQAALLSSTWQQYLKDGVTLTYEEWLREVLQNPDKTRFRSFHRRTALFDLVAKWSAIVGPEKVNVVVLDKDRPEILFDSFESLLALPSGLLSNVKLGGKQANRSMSAAEAEYVRRMNFELRGNDDVAWTEFRSFYRLGAIARLLESRSPGPDEPRILPPRWAAETVSQRAAEEAERIAGLGVQIIGPLDQLSAPTRVVEDDIVVPTQMPIEAASEATLGLFWRALKDLQKSRALERPTAPPEADSSLRTRMRTGVALTDGITTRQLILALTGRAARRVRSTLPRRKKR